MWVGAPGVGVGDGFDGGSVVVVEGVAAGVDEFDCVLELWRLLVMVW